MKYRNCKQRNPASQQNYSNSCKINCLPGNAKMKVDFFFFRKKKKQPYKNRSYRSLNLRKLIRCLGIGSNKNWGRWTTRLGLDCGKGSTVECVRGGRVPYTGWRVSTTCHLFIELLHVSPTRAYLFSLVYSRCVSAKFQIAKDPRHSLLSFISASHVTHVTFSTTPPPIVRLFAIR